MDLSASPGGKAHRGKGHSEESRCATAISKLFCGLSRGSTDRLRSGDRMLLRQPHIKQFYTCIVELERYEQSTKYRAMLAKSAYAERGWQIAELDSVLCPSASLEVTRLSRPLV